MLKNIWEIENNPIFNTSGNLTVENDRDSIILEGL